MKKVWAVGLLSLLSGVQPLCAAEPDGESYLYMMDGEGTETHLGALSSLRSLTFDTTNRTMSVHAKDGTLQSFALNGVERLYFAPYASGIGAEEVADGGNVFAKDGQLHTDGIEPGTPLTLYTVDGRVAGEWTAGTSPIALGGLADGFYVVRAKNVTYKIVKR